MQPKLIHLPEKKIVGLGVRFITIMSPDKDNAQKIPQLWHNFVARTGEIQNRMNQSSIGLVESLPPSETPKKGEMFYIACVEVKNFDAVPDGMIHRIVPAGQYALFTHIGKLNRLQATMQAIYVDWLPKSGFRHRPAPDLELYDRRFKINSDESEFDILIPIE